MNISGVSHFEVCIGVLEVYAALGIIESIPDNKVDKNYVCIGPDSINLSALISRLIRSQVLGGDMGDHFFSSCVVLSSGVSV